MSKSSKLATAIASYNVSECVRDFEDKIDTQFTISTDLNHWAGLEVHTVDELEEWLNAQGGFSDYYKDINGFRPRWDTSAYTLTEWRETYDALEREGMEEMEREKVQAKIDVDAFKIAVSNVRRSGARDFMTAIRWMLQAEGINTHYRQDVESFFYDHNLLFTDYGKSLINRISPLRNR